MHKSISIIALLTLAIPASASSPSAYAALDRRTEAACLNASGLREAKVSDTVRFSDRLAIDARVVYGNWPQTHMKGAKARLLCLYNRRTRRAEVQDLAGL